MRANVDTKYCGLVKVLLSPAISLFQNVSILTNQRRLVSLDKVIVMDIKNDQTEL
jgi:hypothetical protein